MSPSEILQHLDLSYARLPLWQRKAILCLGVLFVWTLLFMILTVAGESVIHSSLIGASY
jgi:hypothetical protein